MRKGEEESNYAPERTLLKTKTGSNHNAHKERGGGGGGRLCGRDSTAEWKNFTCSRKWDGRESELNEKVVCRVITLYLEICEIHGMIIF